MILEERVPLSSLTTLKVGGLARYRARCESVGDIHDAIASAQERGLPWRPLGEGSNVLASDEGYEGVVLSIGIPGIAFKEDADATLVTAGAGVPWDELVRETCARGLWGLENLAGIPGTVGAAPVQNIGAYGAEVKDTIRAVRAYDARSGDVRSFAPDECAFGYRESLFKRDAMLVITDVTFALAREAAPSLAYKDLGAAKDAGTDLSTPEAVASAVRAIRARKFPPLREYGTAGSFFKNPTVPLADFESLSTRYPGIPGFPNETGVKVPLAYVLDKVLSLRGFADGKVSLYEKQPLVLVAEEGASATEVDAFANGIARRVHDATGIAIEREVRSFP